jgi:hypothetical protein
MSEEFLNSSSGHKLGQLIGDWFEEYIAAYLLEEIANKLGLYLDHRFRKRSCRGEKILWQDLDGNEVDYDFVLELDGTDNIKGIPVAFFETFWRRGARHSKDKARDDSGKLLPMRTTYPTARVLGIISAGDFTKPAQELVHSRCIDLFYVPKEQICKSWRDQGIEIDYHDNASEQLKQEIANKVVSALAITAIKEAISNQLIKNMGSAVFNSYIARIIASVSAIPIAYKITNIYVSSPVDFEKHEDAKNYLLHYSIFSDDLSSNMTRQIKYEAIYNDGEIFERNNLTTEKALELHYMVGQVSDYFTKYHTTL